MTETHIDEPITAQIRFVPGGIVQPVAFAWPLTVRFVHEMVNRDKFKNGHR
ncbi:MAG: hypothetical protein MUF26_02055 [Syntrophales bacterium]|nr:hypothetical protein [Syntrophales bacterium]